VISASRFRDQGSVGAIYRQDAEPVPIGPMVEVATSPGRSTHSSGWLIEKIWPPLPREMTAETDGSQPPHWDDTRK